jgi:hypothetical protein
VACGNATSPADSTSLLPLEIHCRSLVAKALPHGAELPGPHRSRVTAGFPAPRHVECEHWNTVVNHPIRQA